MITKIVYAILGAGTLLSWIGLELSSGATRDMVAGWCMVVFLLAGLAFVLGTLVWLTLLRMPPLVGLIPGCLGLALMLYGILPGGDGVVEHVVATDGTELIIEQRHGSEPYSVDFCFRKKGGGWKSFYYEHEDTRWIRGLSHIRLSADQKQATVYRLLWPVATFDMEREAFTIHRWSYTATEPSTRPKDWMPDKA